MNQADAEELTQSVGQSVSGAWRTIAMLQKIGVPKALGLTPEEWVRKRLGGYVRLAVAERYEATVELADAGHSQREIAAALGVHHRTVGRDMDGANAPAIPINAEENSQHGGANAPEPLDAVATLAATERVQEAAAAEVIRKERLDEREQKRLDRPAPPLPSGAYRLLYADPPWRYEHVETESRAIENQYPTMSLDQIKALAVPAADDAVLFLWATSPKLAEAIEVIRAWGFSYRTCAVWDKEVIGMGYYFRQQHELLLTAAKGSLPVPAAADRVSSVIRERRGKHSEKPARVYELLETMYPHFTKRERAELFSRTARAGWTQWSNEPRTATA